MTNSTGTLAKSAPELDLDQLMERIRAEVAERKQPAGPASPLVDQVVPDSDFATRHWTARDLLALPGAKFARAVHLAFLGREPKPDEFIRLRDRVLIAHVSRMRILREFRVSPEMRASGRKLAGFWRASALDRLYWSPPAKFGRSVGHQFARFCRVPRRIREYIARIEALEKRTAEANAAIRNLQSAQAADRQKTGNQISQERDRLDATKEALDAVIATRAGGLEHGLMRQQEITAEMRATLADAQATLAKMRARLADAQTTLADHWRAIVDQKLRVQAFLADAKAPSVRTAGEAQLEKLAREESHLLDALYLSFEDRYRGTRAEIAERQRIYVPRIEVCLEATGGGDVIDIGCGRGEWLELLRELGIPARGFDLNRIAVAECRERGLDVHLGDALHILAALPENGCSALTAFHIIEHVPFEALVTLLDHSLRALKRGGLVLLETPNPGNLIVAAERFYFDPTHRNPLPSELMSYLLKARGFDNVEVLPLHPVKWPSLQSYKDPMLAYLQDKLFGPQDYAVIGRKTA
jgi:SAM-dependent methyltransferase